ncbi:uncharacterized protein LOC128554846 [Mercenaria mercenaria]|uniref:uncharacterized protein LOC128554846 n=1 Tax=Mercenaria mercenaria TaxID=6596 RepID=UPI00234F1515|nr:uncharacterized protein LOC128554846 [Mercenaria mercenaria]
MVFKVSTAIGSYYVSSTLSSWTEKDSICSVAVPPILYTSAGITVDINEISIDRDGAWVGYVETVIALDYIGCLKSATVHSSGMILSQTSRIGSPGQCFSACGFGSFIGISDNECLCLKEGRTLNSLRSNYTECTAECEHQPGVACGGLTENGTRYISVYNLNRKVTKQTNNSVTEMPCLELEPIKQQYIWKKCST